MNGSRNLPSTTSSTRTFRTSSSQPETPRPKRQPPKLPKLPKLPKVPALRLQRTPWLLVVALLIVSLFLFQQYHEARQKLNARDPGVIAKQTKDVIAAVRKLVVVPANQTPTVATVQDVSKLRGQSFFANAQNGDKVLVYAAEKEAILYRPSTNQIVTIAPVNVAAPNSAQ